MTSKTLTVSMIAAYALLHTATLAEEITILDPIVVGADFRDKKLSQTTESVTVIGSEDLYDKSFEAFENVIGQAANVNFSTGASRAHYIQIRGIGERSQYATPVNPSVGIIIDGIDFSQSALGVTMFDVKQIEVLRGPQGTTFGANGMAGVINIESNEPTKELEGHLEATVGNYNTQAFGAAVGGTLIDDTLLGRISIYQNSSDGFMDNDYLNRDDTQDIDELTIKTQLRWLVSDNHTIDLNYMHVDVDNGYDAWTLDNSRTSYSDEPGKDTQKTDAFALKSTYQINPKMHLISKVSYSDSDLEYSYDEDWSYVGEFDESLWPYSSFDQYLRDRKQTDVDVRLVSDEEGRIFNGSTDWTMGVYYKDFKEDMTRHYTYLDGPFKSKYKTQSTAGYGQLDHALNEKFTLVAGLRVEDWNSQYDDTDLVSIDSDEVLVGGKLGLNYQEADNRLYYINLSKGYKPGGVNPDNTLTLEEKKYKTEDLWNLEAGLNSSHFDNQLISRLNIFYGKRRDQQVKSSVVQQRDDGSTQFVDYLTNAAKGSYYGLESELNYYPTDSLHLYSSIGLLHANFDTYHDPDPSAINMNGRTPAQSPEYQYNVGFNYRFVEAWTWKANLEGKDSYYFSNRHNDKSDSYNLLHSSLEYIYDGWTASLWVRNITDKEYQTRGFGSFGNNPAKGYATELYTQQGDPRTFGLTVSYDF